jgi:hypothetical protein
VTARLAAAAACVIAASVGVGCGGQDAAVATAIRGAATGDLSSLSDEFTGTALDPSWSVLNPQFLGISVSGGQLHLAAVPGQDSVWFATSTKALVYKLVTASNFKVTTTVFPRKRTDPTQAPTNALHVGGIMARNPSNAAGENYVFIMMGSNESAVPGVEVKSTTNGSSVFEEPSWPSPLAADLRICRVGSSFQLYKRVPGDAAWTLAITYDRPDLPQTLQVGPTLNYSGPDDDLTVGFERITFAPITSAADCTTDAPPPAVPAAPVGAIAGLALALVVAPFVRRGARGARDPRIQERPPVSY